MSEAQKLVLAAMARLRNQGGEESSGFQIAQEIGPRRTWLGFRSLMGHGTLYRALNELEWAGYVVSRLEDWQDALIHGGPQRRLYRLTMRTGAALTGQDEPPVNAEQDYAAAVAFINTWIADDGFTELSTEEIQRAYRFVFAAGVKCLGLLRERA